MTNEQVLKIVRSTVQIKKEPVGIKVWKNEPKGIPKYEERAFPGMCAQIGELLKTGAVDGSHVIRIFLDWDAKTRLCF